jgi:phosphoribosylamine--glycine ligase
MNILIIGNGGREHALAWKIKQSPLAERVFVAPGNGGTAELAENVDISVTDFPKLIRFAKDNNVGLTVVGPEAPLVAGIVDAFQVEKLRIFGPTKAAAELEGSKVFCKHLLRHADVPTADYHVFREASHAVIFLREREDISVVVKADGLAAGKGVFVCNGRNEAIDAVNRIAKDKQFGAAGNQLLIEERLDGPEVSVLALTDSRTILTLPPAQDHKRAFDGDTGPNTGGMGAYCPTPAISDEELHKVQEQILVPTIHAMKRMRRPFRGVLYAGLILTNQGPKVLEYNVRFGDPECQPLLMRLQSDLVELMEAVVDDRLDRVEPPVWDPRFAVSVVMASAGYPGEYKRGNAIRGLEEAAKIPDVKVFHSGTATADGKVVTNGGRVLTVTALANTIPAAKLSAYTAVKQIRWDGAWCRKDISDKAQRYVRDK